MWPTKDTSRAGRRALWWQAGVILLAGAPLVAPRQVLRALGPAPVLAWMGGCLATAVLLTILLAWKHVDARQPLVERMIVVILLVASVLIVFPRGHGVNRGKQKRTMSDMRTVAAAVEGLRRADGTLPPLASVDDVVRLGGHRFLPARDAWGNELCFSIVAGQACVVSRGRGGELDEGVAREEDWCVAREAGTTRSYDDDLVLLGGRFVRGPDEP